MNGYTVMEEVRKARRRFIRQAEHVDGLRIFGCGAIDYERMGRYGVRIDGGGMPGSEVESQVLRLTEAEAELEKAKDYYLKVLFERMDILNSIETLTTRQWLILWEYYIMDADSYESAGRRVGVSNGWKCFDNAMRKVDEYLKDHEELWQVSA